MNIKKLAVAFGLGLSLACAAGTSTAQTTLSFEDDDIDFVLRDGVVVTSGPLLVGDVFVSIFEIPVFTIFDADGDKLAHEKPETTQARTRQHAKENIALLRLMGEADPAPFPTDTLWGKGYAVWPNDLGDAIRADVGAKAWSDLGGEASAIYDNEGGLQKNTLHIAERLFAAQEKGVAIPTLDKLCAELLEFAKPETQRTELQGSPGVAVT